MQVAQGKCKEVQEMANQAWHCPGSWPSAGAVFFLYYCNMACPFHPRGRCQGGAQLSGREQGLPNYSNEVMEGFVHVERRVLGTGFYIRDLEGKAQLGQPGTMTHKVLFHL